MRQVTEYFPAETGDIREVLPNFQANVRLGKYLKDNKPNILRFTCSDICLWTLSAPQS